MEHTMQVHETHNLRDILTIIFKHKYKILATFLIILIGATVYATKIRQIYEAKSTLLIKYGREYLPRPEDETTRQAPAAVTPQTVINGEISILTSLDLYSRLVKKMGAVNIYPELSNMSTASGLTPESAAIRLLQKNIKVTNIKNSSLIEVSFTHQNPEMVAHVINELVDLFKEKHLEIFSTEGTGFLETQLEKSQKKLEESEIDLAVFKEKNRVYSYEEQKSSLLSQRTTIDSTIKTTLSQISELEQKIAFTKSPAWNIDGAAELRGQLATLQQREAQLLEKYNEGSRTLQSQRQEIQAIKEAMKKRTEEQRQIELSKAEGELSVVRARADSLRRQLGQIEGEIRALDARERDLRELKREAALQEQNYQTYAKKLQDSLINDEMDRRKMVAISVIEKAPIFRIPREQKFNKNQIIAGGFFGGIAAGIALAFLLEFMSPGMTTPMSAERRLGIPVMVAITKKE